MSEAQSTGAKQRWLDCETAAKRLGCGKTHVHDRLYSRMKAEGLLVRVLDNEEAVIEQVRSWPEFNDVRPTLYEPDRREGNIEAMEKLKIAAWFIRKMGGEEKAKKAIELVGQIDVYLK